MDGIWRRCYVDNQLFCLAVNNQHQGHEGDELRKSVEWVNAEERGRVPLTLTDLASSRSFSSDA